MRACSHVTLTSPDVPRQLAFLQAAFGLSPKFANEEFGEVVLASGFRIAVFRVVGKTRDFFREDGERGTVALGVTVDDVDAAFARIEPLVASHGARVSGPPKDHPWGERSFLLVDPDGNRWEVTRTPGGSSDGMLVDH
ncbi:MAG: VOC family protein [Planctomycetota bacterium JB042]